MTDISPHHAARIDQAHSRLDALETRTTKLEIHSAGETVRSQNIEKSLTKIEGSISWLNRLLISGIIMGAIAFILEGGLNVLP